MCTPSKPCLLTEARTCQTCYRLQYHTVNRHVQHSAGFHRYKGDNPSTGAVARRRRRVRVLRSIDSGVCPGNEGEGVPAGHDADDETQDF